MAAASQSSSKSEATLVGSEALAYCTSCKMDLNSVIVAMKGDRIAKVQCFTCKKEHVYKAPKGVTEPSVAPKVKAARKKSAAAAEAALQSVEMEWEKLMSTHKDSPTRAYTMKTQFSLGDKVTHPTFGDGIVGKLIYPNKLEVIFRNQMKVLIHGGQPPAA